MAIGSLPLVSLAAQDVDDTALVNNVKGVNDPKVEIGALVTEFAFTDIRWLPRTLRDLGDAKAYVLFFTTATCPLAGRILPRVQRLADEYEPQGARFAVVNVGPEDSLQDAATQAVELELSMPFVKDFDGSVVAALGIDRTCTAVVLDGQRRLRYRGRVDGAYRFGGQSPDPGRDDLRSGLDQVLAGAAVELAETAVEGCKVTRLAPPANPGLTYAKDIAPLIQQRCQQCHRPGGQAPFALQDYDDVADRGEMIAEVVGQRRMPPWYASRKFGHFANDRELPAAERQAIVAWVNSGMPKGDERDLPPPRAWPTDEWRIGQPDLVLKVPVPIRVPAEGYLDYRYFVLPYRFGADTWVQAIEIKPENPRVLHHANLARVEKGMKYSQDGFLTGQVPGGLPMFLEDGVAARIPAGAALALQCHYVTTGKAEVDHLRVGLVFPKVPVVKEMHHLIVGEYRFEIPPHAPAHRVAKTRVLPRNASVLGMFAHMHLRGRDMTFQAHYPDGRSETLLVVPNYNFAWQDGYVMPKGAPPLPEGTKIEVMAHYDNSAWNPYNPDPSAAVRYGDQTFEEMMFGFLFYVDAHESLDLRIDPKTGRVVGE